MEGGVDITDETPFKLRFSSHIGRLVVIDFHTVQACLFVCSGRNSLLFVVMSTDPPGWAEFSA